MGDQMATVEVIDRHPCEHCAQEVDTTLDVCPFCGVPQKRPHPSRLSLYLAVAALVAAGSLLLARIDIGSPGLTPPGIEAPGLEQRPDAPVAAASTQAAKLARSISEPIRAHSLIPDCPDMPPTCPDARIRAGQVGRFVHSDVLFVHVSADGELCGIAICTRTYEPDTP